jgi:hypothetical protein
VPAALLPGLLELERSPPEDPAAFFAAAIEGDTAVGPGASAAAELMKHAARVGLDVEALAQELRSCGVGEAAAGMFAEAWGILRAGGGVPKLAVPAPVQLADLDWTFGVSASSSEHAAMGATFVQLRLQTRGADGRAELVHMELSLARFYEFLAELESAKARLDLV